MKINWNEKYNTISMYTFLVVSAIMLFYLSISKFETLMDKISSIIFILQPFIIGFSMAYILNFTLKFYEKHLAKSKRFNSSNNKTKRCLAMISTYVTATLLIGLFIQFVLPQLIESIVGLINDFPKFINESTKFINKLMMDLNISEQYLPLINKNFNEFIDYIIKFATGLLPILGNFLTKIASSIWNIVLGVIISIYLLIDKERFCAMTKKLTYAIFSKNVSEKVIELTHRSNDTFGKFLMGKILDSFIIGVLTFVILAITKMPYALLISVIVGITNIIPFFGPFIGAIPSFLIILFVSPIKALWFLFIILIIQQIDGNIIGPKILGDSIGISAFWILFSILVAGKFLGLMGMIIGVPLFAVVYSIMKEVVEANLNKKGLKMSTEDYM